MVRDRMLDAPQGCRRHREAGDPRVEQMRDETRLRGHLAADADLATGGAAVGRHAGDQLQDRRVERVVEARQLGGAAAGGGHVLDQVVGADRVERRLEARDADRDGWHLDHDPDRWQRRLDTASPEIVCLLLQHLAGLFELRRNGDHRQHDLERTEGRGPRQCAELDAEDFRMREAQADAPDAQERIQLTLWRQARDGLVAAGVQGPDGDGLSRCPLDQATIEPVLRFLVGQGSLAVEEEFGARQADAVAGARRQILEDLLALDVDLHGDARPGSADGGRAPVLLLQLGALRAGLLALAEPAGRDLRRTEDQPAGLRVQHGRVTVHQLVERGADADQQRHAARARQDGYVARGAASQKRRPAPAGPVELQEPRGSQVVRDVDAALLRRQQGRAAGDRRERRQHPIAQIRQIARPRGEVLVVRRSVVGNLRLHYRPESPARRLAFIDRPVRRLEQCRVAQELDLEIEDLRGHGAPPGLQALQLQRCPGQRALEELALSLRARGRGAVQAVHGGPAAHHHETVAQSRRRHLAFELALPLRSLVEVAPHQLGDGGQGLGSVGALGLEKEGLSSRGLERQHAGDALGVGPFAVLAHAQPELRLEALGQFGELDRGPRMEPGGVGDQRRSGEDPPDGHRNISSVVARTFARLLPPAASVAAMTAPSTTGAEQTTTLACHSLGNISIAISELVSAPPRSTSTATPLGLYTCSMQCLIAATSVPRPPSALPPQWATRTSRPTICRTMAAAPRATSEEWETITIETRSVMASSTPGRRHRRRAPAGCWRKRRDRGVRCSAPAGRKRGPWSPATAGWTPGPPPRLA